MTTPPYNILCGIWQIFPLRVDLEYIQDTVPIENELIFLMLNLKTKLYELLFRINFSSKFAFLIASLLFWSYIYINHYTLFIFPNKTGLLEVIDIQNLSLLKELYRIYSTFFLLNFFSLEPNSLYSLPFWNLFLLVFQNTQYAIFQWGILLELLFLTTSITKTWLWHI